MSRVFLSTFSLRVIFPTFFFSSTDILFTLTTEFKMQIGIIRLFMQNKINKGSMMRNYRLGCVGSSD